MSKKCQHILGVERFGDRVKPIHATMESVQGAVFIVDWWKFCPLCGVRTAKARNHLRRHDPVVRAIVHTIKASEPWKGFIKTGKFPEGLGATTRPISAPSAV